MNNTMDIIIDSKLLRLELAEMRKNKNLTQAQVAEKSGLSKSTISNIENSEEKGVTLTSIMKYARAIDCSLFVKNKGEKIIETKNELTCNFIEELYTVGCTITTPLHPSKLLGFGEWEKVRNLTDHKGIPTIEWERIE